MVFRQGEREKKLMERSKPPLHNFPMDFKWGNRKILRCMNVNSNGDSAPAPTGDRISAAERRWSLNAQKQPAIMEFERRGSSGDRVKVRPSLPSPAPEERSRRIEYNGIEALRKELMSDLHSKANKMRNVLREGFESPPVKSPPTPPPPVEADGGEARPWNLRSRRAACKAPMIGVNGGGSGGGGNVDCGRILNVDALRKPNNLPETPPANSGDATATATGTAATSSQKRERAKFSYTLSRSEIEQDFLAMTGHRLPRRPKKRPRSVVKILENLAPAMWLTEVHPDHYKVPDAPESGKS